MFINPLSLGENTAENEAVDSFSKVESHSPSNSSDTVGFSTGLAAPDRLRDLATAQTVAVTTTMEAPTATVPQQPPPLRLPPAPELPPPTDPELPPAISISARTFGAFSIPAMVLTVQSPAGESPQGLRHAMVDDSYRHYIGQVAQQKGSTPDSLADAALASWQKLAPAYAQTGISDQQQNWTSTRRETISAAAAAHPGDTKFISALSQALPQDVLSVKISWLFGPRDCKNAGDGESSARLASTSQNPITVRQW